MIEDFPRRPGVSQRPPDVSGAQVKPGNGPIAHPPDVLRRNRPHIHHRPGQGVVERRVEGLIDPTPGDRFLPERRAHLRSGHVEGSEIALFDQTDRSVLRTH